MMNWWNVIKQAGGVMSSGSASAGTESNTSFSESMIEGRGNYTCPICKKQWSTKKEKDACVKECSKKSEKGDKKLGEFW